MFGPFEFNTRYVKEAKAFLDKATYMNGDIALRVYDSNGVPLSTVTVNMQDYGYRPSDGMVFIKDYSENEGTVEALHEAGIVGQPERWLNAGWATDGVAECPLLVEV